MKRFFVFCAFWVAAGCLLRSCGSSEPSEAAAPHPDWSYDAVVYEMNVRQYTPAGTFAAAARELPRLQDLGVDVVWLMPVYPIGVEERKGTLGSYYAISDYCAVNPEFGTMADFDTFLTEAHRLGLRVILDWVANHTSPDARWITEQPADWYVRDSLGCTVVQYDWTDIAKLNYDNAAMRDAMRQAMRFWLDKGVDGFRCDMACEVPIDFWRETLPALRRDFPESYFLAEGEDAALHIDAFDASYAWELHHLLNDIAQGKKGVADLRAYVEKDAAAMPVEAFRLLFTSNHDENSWAGTEFERMGDAARAMAVLTFTLPNGQPLIYTGQEIGFDHRFAFFEKDPVPAWHANDFTDFYRSLIRLRHGNPALAAGERGGRIVYPANDASEQVFLFSRSAGRNEVLVAVNLSAVDAVVTLPFEGVRHEFFTGDSFRGGERTTIPAWGWLVFAETAHRDGEQ